VSACCVLFSMKSGYFSSSKYSFWVVHFNRFTYLVNSDRTKIKSIINLGLFRSGRWRAADAVNLPFSVFYFLIVTSYAQVNYKREFTVDILHCRHTRNGRKG